MTRVLAFGWFSGCHQLCEVLGQASEMSSCDNQKASKRKPSLVGILRLHSVTRTQILPVAPLPLSRFYSQMAPPSLYSG